MSLRPTSPSQIAAATRATVAATSALLVLSLLVGLAFHAHPAKGATRDGQSERAVARHVVQTVARAVRSLAQRDDHTPRRLTPSVASAHPIAFNLFQPRIDNHPQPRLLVRVERLNLPPPTVA